MRLKVDFGGRGKAAGPRVGTDARRGARVALFRVSGRAISVQIRPRGIHARATSLVPCHPGGTTSGALFLHGGASDR
jgi:hypothetical protein